MPDYQATFAAYRKSKALPPFELSAGQLLMAADGVPMAVFMPDTERREGWKNVPAKAHSAPKSVKSRPPTPDAPVSIVEVAKTDLTKIGQNFAEGVAATWEKPKPKPEPEEVEIETPTAAEVASLPATTTLIGAPMEGRKPGVIATILEEISKPDGATHAEIHKALVKRFPEREPKGMLNTIKIQAKRLSNRTAEDKKRGMVFYAKMAKEVKGKTKGKSKK